MHDRASNLILSGGSDGFVRLWQFTQINEAEADEDAHSTAITPVDELLIAPGRGGGLVPLSHTFAPLSYVLLRYAHQKQPLTRPFL